MHFRGCERIKSGLSTPAAQRQCSVDPFSRHNYSQIKTRQVAIKFGVHNLGPQRMHPHHLNHPMSFICSITVKGKVSGLD